MIARLVILSEIIAPYRIPVFNALACHESVDLHVIFLAETDATLRQWLVYKDEIRFSYQVLPSWRRRLGRHSVLLNRGLTDSLRQAAPDAILCGGYNYFASWQAKWWARRRRVPFVLWVESTGKDSRSGNGIIEALKTRFMRDCSAFVVPGKSSLEYVKNYGISKEAIFVAPNAVDNQLFARRAEAVRQDAARHREALQLPARFFLFVGRLVVQKGVFDLLDAYGKLAPELRTEIGLVFVGEGEARAELARRANRIMPGRVQFAGFTQREQLATYYALADVFVFPSHSDPWGLVVNEAMACGLPVISSDAAGCTADLVQDNWNGHVIRGGDVGQLVSAMEELARDSNLRSVMGNRSAEYIPRFSPEAWANGVANGVLKSRVKPHQSQGQQSRQHGTQRNETQSDR
jgi:glycosyltransferase involved in cell wall biosynthesis